MSIATSDNFKPTNPKPFNEWELYPIGDGTYRHWTSTSEVTAFFAGQDMSPTWAKYKFFWIAGIYNFYTGNEFIPIGAPGNIKGVAFTNTVPAAGATTDSQYIYFSGPGTFASFPGADAQPIVLTENLNVISWDGTKATVQAVPVDVDTNYLTPNGGFPGSTQDLNKKISFIEGAFTAENPPMPFTPVGDGFWGGNVGEAAVIKTTTAGYKYADLMDVKEGDRIILDGFNLNGIATNGLLAWIDSDGNYLGRLQGDTAENADMEAGHFEASVGAGVAKIGLYFYNTDEENFPIDKVTIGVNTLLVANSDNLPKATEDIKGVNETTDDIKNSTKNISSKGVLGLKQSIFPASLNADFPPYSAGYWTGTVGNAPTVTVISGWQHKNDLLDCKTGDTVILDGYNYQAPTSMLFLVLDADGNFLKRINYSDALVADIDNGHFEVPITVANVAKIAVNFNTASGSRLPADAKIAVYPGGKNPNKIDPENIDIDKLSDLLPDNAKKVLNAISDMYNRGAAPKNYDKNLIALAILVFWALGQSQIDGRNAIADFPVSYQDEDGNTVNYLDGTTMTGTYYSKNQLNPNFAPYVLNGKWGFDVLLLKKLTHYLESKGVDVYELKRSLGGTAIDTTGTDGGGFWTPLDEQIDKYNEDNGKSDLKLLLLAEQAFRRMIANGIDIRCLKFVLFIQGEGDSTINAAIKYYDNLINVIDYIRGVVGNPKLPIFMSTVPHASAQYNTIVEQAQKDIAAQDENIYLIDMKDAQLIDQYHFNAEWSEYLATEIYTILRDKILPGLLA